jgi:hypothetical protein
LRDCSKGNREVISLRRKGEKLGGALTPKIRVAQ